MSLDVNVCKCLVQYDLLRVTGAFSCKRACLQNPVSMVNRRSLTESSSNSLCTGSCQPSVQDHPNMFKLVQLGLHSTGTPLGYVQTCSLRNTYSRQVSGWHPPQSQIQDFFDGSGVGCQLPKWDYFANSWPKTT